MRGAASRWLAADPETAARATLVGLVVVAFLLRVDGFDESLYGDELYTHRIVSGANLGDVLGAVRESAITPPLHYLLAWGSVQLGDDETMIRLPSLVLGTATIPTVYLLARRFAGRSAAVLAAALIAIDPFAVFFSTEARAYATLLFLVPLSTLALLRAVDSGRPGWWALYSASSVCALYTHYTAAIPVAVQAIWVLWTERSRIRSPLLANAVICGAYLLWIPAMLAQDQAEGTAQIAGVHPLSVESFGQASGRLLFGYQLVDLHEVPGPAAVWLFSLGAGTAAVSALLGFRLRRGADQWGGHDARMALLVALAVAAPIAVLAYSLAGTDIYTARNIITSLPALAILLSILLLRLRRGLALAATIAVLAALCVGSVRALDPDRNRPPFRQAAAFIDSRARPGEPVVELVFLGYRGEFTHHLDVEFNRPHPTYKTGFAAAERRDPWKALARADRFFFVGPWVAAQRSDPLPPAIKGRFGLVGRRILQGTVPLTVATYRSAVAPGPYRLIRRGGHEMLIPPEGIAIRVGSQRVAGSIDHAELRDGALDLTGWSGVRGGRAARVVPVFLGGRFLVALRPVWSRPDVAASGGAGLRRSGFSFSVPVPRTARASDLRVFGVSGDEAAELAPVG